MHNKAFPMKTRWLIFLLVGLCSGALLAQGLQFGIKAGGSLASQKIEANDEFIDPDDIESMFTFHGGVFLTYMFNEKIGVQPELLYFMYGSTSSWGDDSYEDQLGYLTIPLLFRYNVNELVSLHAGPQFGFLMSANETYLGDKEDIKDDFNSTDIGLAFGAEVDLASKFGFGARYSLGLTDIVNQDGSWGGYSTTNNALQLYVKYRIVGD